MDNEAVDAVEAASVIGEVEPTIIIGVVVARDVDSRPIDDIVLELTAVVFTS